MPYYFAIAGAVCLVFGSVMLWRRLMTLARGRVVTGQIVRWEKIADSETPGTYFYHAHIAFADADGMQHTMRLDHGHSSEKYPLGHPYRVRFDPANPARAYPANPFVMLAGTAVILTLGVVGIYAGFTALH